MQIKTYFFNSEDKKFINKVVGSGIIHVVIVQNQLPYLNESKICVRVLIKI